MNAGGLGGRPPKMMAERKRLMLSMSMSRLCVERMTRLELATLTLAR